MLLLHEFHARKFMLPDKLTGRDRERLAKEARSRAAADADEDEPQPGATLFIFLLRSPSVQGTRTGQLKGGRRLLDIGVDICNMRHINTPAARSSAR